MFLANHHSCHFVIQDLLWPSFSLTISHHCISRQSLREHEHHHSSAFGPQHSCPSKCRDKPNLHRLVFTLLPLLTRPGLSTCLAVIIAHLKMSTYSPRRHTHDSTSRPKPHYNDYEPTPMRYELTTSPPSTSTSRSTSTNERNPIDRGTSYPPPGPHDGHNHHHRRTSNGSSSSHATGHRPPPRLIKKTSFTSSTYPSSSRPHRKQSIDPEDYLVDQDEYTPHRSGSVSSFVTNGQVHHVHHKSGHHAHHRHHSGHRHENGHGSVYRRPPSPDVLDEDVEDIDDAPTRAHVNVYNADQFWAGRLGPPEIHCDSLLNSLCRD